MYNMIHGVNPLAGMLLAMLDLKHEQVPRFRDCFLFQEREGGAEGPVTAGPLEIHVYTRMGGGNRECWEEGKPGCECAACGTGVLTEHPLYLRDFDDDFDITYATYCFSVPETFREDMEQLVAMRPDVVPESPEQRFADFITRMKTRGTEDPEVRRVTEAMEPLLKAIEEAGK